VKKILIVDNEEILRLAVKKNLSQIGYQVYVASNGQEGFKIFQEKKPQMVILDLKMPVMGGLEALQKIKKISQETEVVIITAFADMETSIRAIKLGAFDYIQKPVDFEQLEIVISRGFERIEMRQRLADQVIQLENALAQRDQAIQRRIKGVEKHQIHFD